MLMNAYAGSLKASFRHGNLKFKYELPLTFESSGAFIFTVSFKLNYCVLYPHVALIMYGVRNDSYNKQRLSTGWYL
jgi:uncharacterized protein YdhG (YjbR/CyaY superfamily)